jgi:hypothetical protein
LTRRITDGNVLRARNREVAIATDADIVIARRVPAGQIADPHIATSGYAIVCNATDARIVIAVNEVTDERAESDIS